MRRKDDIAATAASVEHKPAIAPVLRPSGRANNGLSEGLVLLSRGQVVDLEAAERFRILRAQTERRALEAGPQQVTAVTSAVPSEGKSVVSVNLARAFGTDPRGKTLLIDCDLRKPNVHRFFNQMQSPGLSDILVAGKPIRSVLRSVEPGLDLITAGSPVIDSSRAIEQPGMGLMLEELKKHYLYIVLDCPPVLFCSEPLHLSHLADSSLIVARSWRTEKKLVKDAVTIIGKKSIAGVVLNECNDTVAQYGYYGYYGYDKQAIAKAKAKRGKRRVSAGASSGTGEKKLGFFARRRELKRRKLEQKRKALEEKQRQKELKAAARESKGKSK